MSSTYAVEDAIRQTPGNSGLTTRDGEPNEVARLVRNLILGGEYLMSHITHWYTLSALDYVQGPYSPPFTPYLNYRFFNPALVAPYGAQHGLRWSTYGLPAGLDALPARGVPSGAAINAGKSAASHYKGLDGIWDNVIVDYLEALRWRREALAVIAPLAGRTPQFQTVVAGGVNCRPASGQVQAIKNVLGNDTSGLIGFIKNNYIPCVQAVSYLYGPYGGATSAWPMRKYDNNGTEIFSGYGSGIRNFLSFGVFNTASAQTSETDPSRLLRRGYLYGGETAGASASVNTVNDFNASSSATCTIREFIYGSHYQVDGEKDASSAYMVSGITPWDGYTDPKFEDVHNGATGYSWIKSPRVMHSGSAIACQVGPLARMAVTGARGEGTGYTTLATFASAYTNAAAVRTALDSECTSYKLGMSKTNVMLLHPTLKEILYEHASAGPTSTIQSLFGTIPNTFLCGASVMDRHRARAYEALKVANAMKGWCDSLITISTAAYPSGYVAASGYANYTSFNALPKNGIKYFGRGMHEAPRGALSHWITLKDGKIDNYQCVVPTTWNAGPRHATAASGLTDPNHFVRGPIEQAIMGHSSSASSAPAVEGWGSPGYPLASSVQEHVPVEILRIVHSFDPCIACAVH